MAIIPAFGCALPLKSGRRIYTLPDAYKYLSEAHDFLAHHAQTTLVAVSGFPAKDWGTRIRREAVTCPANECVLVGGGEIQHNLAEVVNTCATVERLLDALKWAASGSEFSSWFVECCHATKIVGQNDLLLVEHRDGSGRYARFEVSDLSGSSEGNDRELKDLISLGVLKWREGKAPHLESIEMDGWSEDRLFLAVSTEFAMRLESRPVVRPGRTSRRFWLTGPFPHCHYQQREQTATTVILEVLQDQTLPAVPVRESRLELVRPMPGRPSHINNHRVIPSNF